MATTIKNGSRGTDVKNLQTQLNSLGYNLATDGVFGKNTLAAVRDYQSKNGLTVDGIVGKNTWNSLLGKSAANGVNANTNAQANTQATGVTQQTGPSANSPANTSSTTSKTTTTIKSYNQPYQGPGEYTPSESVNAALQKLQQAEAQRPGDYQSQYKAQLDDIMNGLIDREPFKYDLNGDMLWQQYKDQYTTLGQQAMRDTMGNAAALSGGYGNSYASTVGNQAYQSYLQQLNERIPELYDRARNNYDKDLQWDLQAYELMNNREAQDYDRYRDQLSDYYNDMNLANDRYQTERNFDYNRYSDDRDFGYNTWLNNRNFEYQQERDNVADNQWQTSFDEDKRRYDQEWAYQLQQDALAAGSGGSGGGSGRGRRTGNPGKDDAGDDTGITADDISRAKSIFATSTSEADAKSRIMAIGGIELWNYLRDDEKMTNPYWRNTKKEQTASKKQSTINTQPKVVTNKGITYSKA